jgi:hypothetical protein
MDADGIVPAYVHLYRLGKAIPVHREFDEPNVGMQEEFRSMSYSTFVLATRNVKFGNIGCILWEFTFSLEFRDQHVQFINVDPHC